METIAALRQQMIELMRGGIRTMNDPCAPGMSYYTGYTNGNL